MTECLPRPRTIQEKAIKLLDYFQWTNSRAFYSENLFYQTTTSIEWWLSTFVGSSSLGMSVVRDALWWDVVESLFNEVGNKNVYEIAKSKYWIDIDAEIYWAIYPKKVLPKDAANRSVEIDKLKVQLNNSWSPEYKAYINALANWTDKEKLAFWLNYVQTANKIQENMLSTLETLKTFAPQYVKRFEWMVESVVDNHISYYTKSWKDIDSAITSYNWISYIEWHWWKVFEWTWDEWFFTALSRWRTFTKSMVENVKSWFSKSWSLDRWNTWRVWTTLERLAWAGATIFKASTWVSPISYMAMAQQWIQAMSRNKLVSKLWWEAYERIKNWLPDSRLINQSMGNDLAAHVSWVASLEENWIIWNSVKRAKDFYRNKIWSIQTPQDIVDVMAEETILSLWYQKAIQEMYWTIENFIYRFDNWLISDVERAETLRLWQMFWNEERWIMRHVALNGTQNTPWVFLLKSLNFRWFFWLNKLRTFMKYTAYNIMENWTKAFNDPNLWQYLYWIAAQVKAVSLYANRDGANDEDDQTVKDEIKRMLWYTDWFSFINGTWPWRIVSTVIWEAFSPDELTATRIAQVIWANLFSWFKWFKQFGNLWIYNQKQVREEILWTTTTSIVDSVSQFMYWYDSDEFKKAKDIKALNSSYNNKWDSALLITALQNTEWYKALQLIYNWFFKDKNEYRLTEEDAKIIQNTNSFTWTPLAKAADNWDYRWMMSSLIQTDQAKMRKFLFSLLGKNNIINDLKAWADVWTEQWDALEDATLFKWNSVSAKEAEKWKAIWINPELVIAWDYNTLLTSIASLNDKDVAVKAKAIRWLSAEWAGAWEIKIKALTELMIYRVKAWSKEMFDPNIWDVVPMSVISERYWLPLTDKWKKRKTPSTNNDLTFERNWERWNLVDKTWTLWIEYNQALQDHILEQTMPYLKSANVQKFISVLAAWATMVDPALKWIISFDWTSVSIKNPAASSEINKILLSSVISRDKPELAIEIYKAKSPNIYIEKTDDPKAILEKVTWYAKWYETRAKIWHTYKENPAVMAANVLAFAWWVDSRVIQSIYDNIDELRKTSPALVSEFEKSMTIMKWQGNEMTDFIQNYMTGFEWMKLNPDGEASWWKSKWKWWKSIKVGKITFKIDEIKQAQTKLGNLQFASSNATRQPVFTFKPREQKQIYSNSWWDKATSKSYDTAKRQSNAKVAFSFPTAWRRKSKWNKKLGIWVFKF